MKNAEHSKFPFVVMVGLSTLFACSLDADDTGGTGGAGSGTGGAGGAGGANMPKGGTQSSAGASNAGKGGSTTGGSTSAGGASGASGTTAGTNGSAGKSGGTSGAGGTPSGEAGRGTMGGGAGALSGAGGAGAGGAGKAGAGAGGSSAAGASGTAGTGGAAPGLGCGNSEPLASGRATIDVAGAMREYVLALPDDYDSSQPYKLIFAWHWRGGVANDVVSGSIIGGPYYGLEEKAQGSAIFVAPEGIDNGWANTNGRDIDFLKAMLELFDSQLCIDHERIFSLGFSYGGMMSDAIGCEMADVFRAIAPMSGALYSGCREANDHPIAVWLAHGDNDTVVPLADGEEALDVFLARNQCQATTSPVDPSPCVEYAGCTDGYPVHYCKFSGGHSPQNWAPAAVWSFFSQF